MPGGVGGKGYGHTWDWLSHNSYMYMYAGHQGIKKRKTKKDKKKKKKMNKKEKKSSVTSSSMLANSFLKWSLYVILHGLETWKFMLSLLRRRN